jgi:hypothetical protein
MAIFTYWLARHMQKGWAVVLGQFSRIIFTSGAVALCISLALAFNLLTPATSPIAGMTSSFISNLGTSWLSMTVWAIILSATVNAIVSLVIVLLLTRTVENSLKS